MLEIYQIWWSCQIHTVGTKYYKYDFLYNYNGIEIPLYENTPFGLDFLIYIFIVLNCIRIAEVTKF